MSKIAIAVEGFIANELSVSTTPNGHRVVNVTVPHTPRKRDETGEWVDAGATVWTKAAFWNEHADAVLGSAHKGTLVSLTGTGVEPQAWEANGKTGVNLYVTNPVLAVIVQRPRRTQDATGNPGWAPTPPNPGTPAQQAAEPAWGEPGSYSDETPF